MRPLYFPFTNISEPVLGALLACFRQVEVYQPSRNHVPEALKAWEARGRLRIHLPVEDENDPLPHLLKAYHAWAELHEGERPDFEKYRPAATPLMDTSATSRIRSDILKAAARTATGSSRENKEEAMLLRARLFLTVAQEHDKLRQTLREDLDRIGNMEKNLFRNLLEDQEEKSFQRSSLDQPTGENETDCYMYGERLIAWARLHVHHRKSIDPGTASVPETPDLLITSDRFALDQLLEQAEEVESICSVSGIPFGPPADMTGDVFFDKKRFEKLEELAADPSQQGGWDTFFSDAGNGTGDTGRLTIYRLRGDAVTSFLSKSANDPGPSRMKEETVGKQFTLAGSISPIDP